MNDFRVSFSYRTGRRFKSAIVAKQRMGLERPAWQLWSEPGRRGDAARFFKIEVAHGRQLSVELTHKFQKVGRGIADETQVQVAIVDHTNGLAQAPVAGFRCCGFRLHVLLNVQGPRDWLPALLDAKKAAGAAGEPKPLLPVIQVVGGEPHQHQESEVGYCE